MATQFERKHVSRLISTNHKILMPLLLAVTIVNSAVSLGNIHTNCLQNTDKMLNLDIRIRFLCHEWSPHFTILL
jgi:hypothetical protein